MPKEGSFLENVVLGGSDEENSAELTYFLRKDKWSQRFGTELVRAIVLFYGPELAKRNYKLPAQIVQDFKRIVATFRKDNVASEKILKNVAMTVYATNEKFGNIRDLYEIFMPHIVFLKEKRYYKELCKKNNYNSKTSRLLASLEVLLKPCVCTGFN